MPGRRSFLIGCGSMVAAPALARLALPLPEARPLQTARNDAQSSTALASATQPEDVVLRIDGWDTPNASGPAARGEVWIHINSSWRAAWR